MPRPRPPTPLRYAAAAALVGLATLARLALDPLVGDRLPFVTFLSAVILSAWLCGTGPSLVALALGCLSADYFFLQPRGSLAVTGFNPRLAFVLFVLISLTVTLLAESLRSARARAEASEAEARGALAAERSHRRSLRTTLASIADAVVTTDADGRITTLNRVAERLTGWAEADAAGRPLMEVFRTVDGATQGAAEMPVAEVLENGATLRSGDHMILVSRDGRTRPVEHSTAPIREEGGRITGMVLVFRDVTGRLRAEHTMRESERRLTQLADTMPQIVWTAGPDGRVDYFNARWHEYTGRPPGAPRANDWRDAVHPDDLSALSEARERAVGGGSAFEAEVRLRGRGGGYRWHLVRSVPVRDGEARVARRFGSATDIDDIKRAEGAVRANEERLRLALAAGRMGTWEWDIPTGEIAWSPNLEEIHGLAPGSFDGTYEGFERLVHPDDRGAVAGAIARSLDDGSEFEAEFRIVRPDGAVHWMCGKGRAYGDGPRMLGVGMDVTERKRLEDELRLRMLELAEADRRKDEFLATLAHELRNPLAPIRNALHLMARPDGGGDGHEAERSMAERQVAHLARLIDDLMDVSRISRGKAELRKEVVDLAAVARHALAAARPLADVRGHALTARLPAEPLLLEADPARLEQVVTNLLVNAAKYTDPGGRIRLTVAREAGAAVVRVADNGIGIEPGMLPRVFDLFVQAERRLDRSQGGLGIGLSLVKSLVEMHGGSVTAYSEGPGRGCEFVVRLPAPGGVAEVGGQGPRAARPRTGRGMPSRRILVVDDNVDAADSLGRLLSRLWGQEVRVAYDGPGALEVARSFRPEVVLLDIGLPGMDGCEVARRLRAGCGTADALLVAVTGWGQERDRLQAGAAGFNHHLVKPVDPESLKTLLTASVVTAADHVGCME